MYTNTKEHGGNFKDVLDKEFIQSQSVSIATGYASLDIINNYKRHFTNIVRNGGLSRLLLGMAFYEGLSQRKLDILLKLNSSLKEIEPNSGVFVTNGRRYHGKVYNFNNGENSNLYVGSSNFSSSGTKGNIECTIPILMDSQKYKIINFLEDLYSPSFAIPIHKAEITVPGKNKIVLNKVDRIWNNLKTYDPTEVRVDNLPLFTFPLDRIADKEKSNLNVYFGKGRWSRYTEKIKPRPWYEIELIASKDLTSQPFYPKGDFLAYTDDGIIIPMRTQGDFYKNIRSRESLQLFGIWLKGKLEKKGILQKYQPVTVETLEEYGNNELTFHKFEEGRYYMHF